jgi:hypothetical protein
MADEKVAVASSKHAQTPRSIGGLANRPVR